MPALTPTPDADLLARFREGEPDAFNQIVVRYGGLVFSCCLRVTGDAHRAEDLAQETFFRLSQRPDQVSRSLPAWLHTVATRVSIDALRRAKTRKRHERSAGHEAGRHAFSESAPPGVMGRPDEASWSEIAPKLDAALGELPEPSRDILVRHFLMGVPQRTLAGELGVSQATVSRRVNLALEQLRKRLGQRGVSMGAPAVLAMQLGLAPAHAAPAQLVQSAGGMSLMQTLAPVAGPAAAPLAFKIALCAVPVALVGAAAFMLVQWAAIKPQGPAAPTRAQVQQRQIDLMEYDAGHASHEDPEPHPNTQSLARFDTLILPATDEHGAFLTTTLVAIQRPAGNSEAELQAVFADGHVETLTQREAARLIEQQTGRTLAELLAEPHVAPAATRPSP
ncbi:sigma-70 family RNA polymerase sigma factor [Phycisphaeraceae bacterium D3-23]